ncbi:hypothetical protein K488DRAFT_29833, partial [Vararia minispora EC-137]
PSYAILRGSRIKTRLLAPDTSFNEIIGLDVKPGELEAFLSILFPLDYDKGDIATQEEWTAALKLATRWSFPSVRSLAIRNLNNVLSPIDRLVLARTYDVKEWVDQALNAFIRRNEPLALEEGLRMLPEDVLLISGIRD